MRIRTKRVYEDAANADGRRILVDRLWPRGLSKEKARIHHWVRSVAPSDALRKWYRHDPEKWDEFRRRYFGELDANEEGRAELREAMEGTGTVTLLYGTRETERNNATALQEYLASGPGRTRRRKG